MRGTDNLTILIMLDNPGEEKHHIWVEVMGKIRASKG